MFEERGTVLSSYLATGHAQKRLADAKFSYQLGEKGWESRACNMSLLAALSPVIRRSLHKQDNEELVLISSDGAREVLVLLYTGAVYLRSREQAVAVRQILDCLGIHANLSLVSNNTHNTHQEEEAHAAALTDVVSDSSAVVDKSVFVGPRTTVKAAVKLTATSGDNSQQVEEEEEKREEEIQAETTCNSRKLTCPDCGYSCMTAVGVATHLADNHQGVSCDLCFSEIRGGIAGLMKHVHAVHPAFAQSRTAARDSVRKPICPLCGTALINQQALRYHLYKHAGLKPYRCSLCDASFRTPSTLRAHTEVQHLAATQRAAAAHVCHKCGIVASTSGKLKIHQLRHAAERPLQCATCGARFRQRSVLRVHEFTHSQLSSHKCASCGRYFATKNKLGKHTSACIRRAVR